MKARVSRRHMLATIPAAAAAMTSAPQARHRASDGPSGCIRRRSVFAAIMQHREAMQALAVLHEPPDALLAQLSRPEVHAFPAWLTTPPTTLAGVLATLDYAARSALAHEDGNGSHVHANLAEAMQYDADGDADSHDILRAGEAFPAMLARRCAKSSAADARDRKVNWRRSSALHSHRRAPRSQVPPREPAQQ